MVGLNKCGTCHWISRDGRCFCNSSPHGLRREQMSSNDSCSYYKMDVFLERKLEEQEIERKEREKRDQKERERQEWLKTEAGQKWQAEENRKKEGERKEKERKEREHQEWLVSDEGQKWQAEERAKEKKQKIKKLLFTVILSILYFGLVAFLIYCFYHLNLSIIIISILIVSIMLYRKLLRKFG